MMRSVRSFLESLKSGSASRSRDRLNVQCRSGPILPTLFMAVASKCKCSTWDLFSCNMTRKSFNPKISPVPLLI